MIDEKLNGIIRALELCTGNETTCKDCPYQAAVSTSFSVRCEDTLHEASLEAIEALKAENATLRARLEKARIKERGEVFTAEREVKAMCDLIPEKIMKEWERYND